MEMVRTILIDSSRAALARRADFITQLSDGTGLIELVGLVVNGAAGSDLRFFGLFQR